jgi:hypothetical protein
MPGATDGNPTDRGGAESAEERGEETEKKQRGLRIFESP